MQVLLGSVDVTRCGQPERFTDRFRKEAGGIGVTPAGFESREKLYRRDLAGDALDACPRRMQEVTALPPVFIGKRLLHFLHPRLDFLGV